MNREKMLATFEELFGLPGDQIMPSQWECWLGIWGMAWKYAEKSCAAPELLEALDKAEQLATIAWDWDLGTDGHIELRNDEWVSVAALRDEFRAIIAKARGES